MTVPYQDQKKFFWLNSIRFISDLTCKEISSQALPCNLLYAFAHRFRGILLQSVTSYDIGVHHFISMFTPAVHPQRSPMMRKVHRPNLSLV